MLVSAVSANINTVFNTRVNSRGGDNTPETSSNSSNPDFQSAVAKQSNIFDSINEWKHFCHKQIEQGRFDVIA